MGKVQKWLIPLATVSAAGMILAGCGSNTTNTPSNTTTPAANQPVDGGTLTFAEFTDVVNLDPLYIQDVPSGDAANFIYANLYDYNRQGAVTVEPWSLAAELPQITNDGKTYTIKLKDTPKWSDGTPVTADDVLFTFNSARNKDYASPAITNFDKVQDIKKVDDHTIQIDLKSVYAPFQYVLATAVVPYHLLKDVAPKDLAKYAYGTDPTKTVGDGPYKWTEWKQKEYLSFDKDPNYWGPKVHVDKYVYKIYADQNTEVQALLKGDVDLVSGIPVTQLAAVQAHKDITLIQHPGPQYEYMGFNFDPKNFPGNFDPFLGEKTRQAIAYALNRQGMVDNILKGTGTLINSPFLPTSWAYDASAPVNYTYDPNKAKQLLADDGWKPGPDGILMKDGHRFSFELQYNTGNSRRQQVSAVIQQNLKDVGIEVKPKGLDFSSWIDQNINPGKYPAILLAWVMNTPDPDQESTFSSKYFPPNGQNGGWYKDPTLDNLWVQGWSTTDQAQRKQIYSQAAKEVSTNLPYVFLYQYGSPQGIGPKVHYAEADAPEESLSYGYFFHFYNWWIK
jgi:peptide/nickel transport system substrate-binding protein